MYALSSNNVLPIDLVLIMLPSQMTTKEQSVATTEVAGLFWCFEFLALELTVSMALTPV